MYGVGFKGMYFLLRGCLYLGLEIWRFMSIFSGMGIS